MSTTKSAIERLAASEAFDANSFRCDLILSLATWSARFYSHVLFNECFEFSVIEHTKKVELIG